MLGGGRCLRPRRGQTHAELGSRLVGACELERPTVRLGDPPADREAGALPWRPRAWRSQLRLTIASPDGVRHWRWADAPVQRDGQGRWRLAEVPTAPCFARLDMEVPSPWIFDRWGWCEL